MKNHHSITPQIIFICLFISIIISGNALASNVNSSNEVSKNASNSFQNNLIVNPFNEYFIVTILFVILIIVGVASIFNTYYDNFQDLNGDGGTKKINKIDLEEKNRVIQIMKDNFGNTDFNISKLADILELNPNSISRYMKNSIGVSFRSLWNEIRMEEAKKMLQSGKKVGDVSFEVGFQEVASFSKAFKKYENISPLKYKLNYQKMLTYK